MIDIHSHILPGLDDGSPDLITSIRMAELAVAEGIKKMIATPHFIEHNQEIDRELIVERVEELNRELAVREINLTILPGQEILLTPGIPELLQQGKLVTLGDKGMYLLVELPMMSIPLYAEEVIHRTNLQGCRVILAHPERNLEIIKKPDRLNDFIKMGTLVQVNSLSLIGVFGKEAKRTAEGIIRSEMAHFIATNCHTARTRSPRVKEVLNSINAETTKRLLSDNPSKVLRGKKIEIQEASYTSKSAGFSEKVSLFFNSLV